MRSPKTGARCGCKPGAQRDNCPTCEGSGMVIDFAAIRAMPPAHGAACGAVQSAPDPRDKPHDLSGPDTGWLTVRTIPADDPLAAYKLEVVRVLSHELLLAEQRRSDFAQEASHRDYWNARAHALASLANALNLSAEFNAACAEVKP